MGPCTSTTDVLSPGPSSFQKSYEDMERRLEECDLTQEEQFSEVRAVLDTNPSYEKLRAFNKDIGFSPEMKKQLQSDSLQVGEKLPTIRLTSVLGHVVSVDALLASGPVVLVFYKGHWCPFCNIQLKLLQRELRSFQELNATLVAVSPTTPDFSLTYLEKHQLAFPVLSDVGCRVAEQLRVAVRLTPEHVDLVDTDFRPIDIMKAMDCDREHVVIPIPSVFVVDQDHTVVWRFIKPIDTGRAPAASILEVLRGLYAVKHTAVESDLSRGSVSSRASTGDSRNPGFCTGLSRKVRRHMGYASPLTLERLLVEPAGVQVCIEYLGSIQVSENLMFWDEVNKFRIFCASVVSRFQLQRIFSDAERSSILENVWQRCDALRNAYLTPDCNTEIMISRDTRDELQAHLDGYRAAAARGSLQMRDLVGIGAVYDSAREETLKLFRERAWPLFQRSSVYKEYCKTRGFASHASVSSCAAVSSDSIQEITIHMTRASGSDVKQQPRDSSTSGVGTEVAKALDPT